jgi:tetratricopeptide (TPR) repeat protein
LRAVVPTNGGDGGLERALELLAQNPTDPWLALLVGRLAVAGNKLEVGLPHLMRAARANATAPYALVTLAPIAPRDRLGEILPCFYRLPEGLRLGDEIVYALGLMHWRLGHYDDAGETWTGLSAGTRGRYAAPLDLAMLWRARELLAARRLTECLAVLRRLVVSGKPEALIVWRSLALAALQTGDVKLAREAARPLAASQMGVDRAILALVRSPGLERLQQLKEVRAISGLPSQLQLAVLRAEVAEALRAGDWAHARCAAALAPNDLDMRLASWVAAMASGDEAGQAAPMDLWHRLSETCGDTPDLVRRCAGEPDPTASPERQAAFWLQRAQRDRVVALLAAVQKTSSSQPAIAHILFLVNYVRASLALPAIDRDLWCQVFAQLAAFIENERWLGAWVVSRLAVYGVRDDYAQRTTELQKELRLALERRLTQVEAQAHERGDTAAAATVRQLRADLARELQAAAAMWKSEKVRGKDGERLAFGPVFARQTERTGLVQEALRQTVRQGDSAERETLRQMLQALARRPEEIAQFLDEHEGDDLLALRQWFSELGEAAALQAAGDIEAARARALDVLIRWTPPDTPPEEEFRQANPAYGGIAEGMERLRADAGRMISRLTIAAFRSEIASAGFDVDQTPARLREIISEAVALRCEDAARGQLTRLVLGKQQQLLEQETLESAHLACTLVRCAAKTGLDGLEGPQAVGLMRAARLFAKNKRFGEAGRLFQELSELRKDEPVHLSNAVAMLLKQHELLVHHGRTPEADEALTEVKRVIDSGLQRFPREGEFRQLSQAVAALRAGVPLGNLMQIASEQEEGEKPAELGPEAVELVGVIRAEADLGKALPHIRRLLDLAPDHPTSLRVCVPLLSRHARALPVDEGRVVFDDLDRRVTIARRRYPGDEMLLHVAALVNRQRRLFYTDSPIEELHRKALRLYFTRHFAEAANILKLVFARSPRRDAELCLLLAECLIGAVASGDGRSENAAAARELLKLAARHAPDDPRIADLQARLSEER